MIRMLLTIFTFMAALVVLSAFADHHGTQEETVGLDPVFDQMSLSADKRKEVRDIMTQFREDRRKAERALQQLNESLPPQEEVRAMRAYSDAMLEYRLTGVLTDAQLEMLMAHFEEQRRQREESRQMSEE